MKNLKKFEDESLQMNQLIKIKGGDRNGGDDSCDATFSYTHEGQADEDGTFHYWNDDGTSNGSTTV